MITHKIKNIALLVMAILLLISGTLNILQLNSAKMEQQNRLADNLRNQIETAGHKAMAEFHKGRGDDLQSELVLTRDSFKVAQKPLYDENRALKEKIEIWRPLVAQKIEADPDLKEFSGAQDSAILLQSKIIASLEVEKANEIKKNDAIRNENRAEVNELVLMTNSLQESLVDEQSESRKWKKKADKKFSVGPTIGYGISKDGLSPQVGISIQWRWLRF